MAAARAKGWPVKGIQPLLGNAKAGSRARRTRGGAGSERQQARQPGARLPVQSFKPRCVRASPLLRGHKLAALPKRVRVVQRWRRETALSSHPSRGAAKRKTNRAVLRVRAFRPLVLRRNQAKETNSLCLFVPSRENTS